MKECIDNKIKDKKINRDDMKKALDTFKENRKKDEIPDFVKNMFL